MDNVTQRIIAARGADFLRRSALNLPEGEDTLRSVMLHRRVVSAVEIGTFRGCSTAVMAGCCQRVTTFDLADGKDRGEAGLDREALWGELGIENISLKLVRDNAQKRAEMDKLDFDFAFIDGAHEEDEVAFDFEITKRCGCVLFHDADFSGRPKRDGVFRFVQSLPKTEVTTLGRVFALWCPNG